MDLSSPDSLVVDPRSVSESLDDGVVRAGLAALSPLCWVAMALFFTAAAPAASAGDPIVVRLDQARLLKLPDRAATVVIGNPLIADLSLQPGGLAVITGKCYGATNIIVMDRAAQC